MGLDWIGLDRNSELTDFSLGFFFFFFFLNFFFSWEIGNEVRDMTVRLIVFRYVTFLRFAGLGLLE